MSFGKHFKHFAIFIVYGTLKYFWRAHESPKIFQALERQYHIILQRSPSRRYKFPQPYARLYGMYVSESSMGALQYAFRSIEVMWCKLRIHVPCEASQYKSTVNVAYEALRCKFWPVCSKLLRAFYTERSKALLKGPVVCKHLKSDGKIIFYNEWIMISWPNLPSEPCWFRAGRVVCM